MRASAVLAVSAVLAATAASCGGGDDGGASSTSASVTTAPATTQSTAPVSTAIPTTTAPSTTLPATTRPTTTLPTTTVPATTTTVAPPEIAWGEPVSVLLLAPSFFSQPGDVVDAEASAAVSTGAGAVLLVGADVAGKVHDLGGLTQTDHYSDVRMWMSTDGLAWTERPGPSMPGQFDEWVEATTARDGALVAVGAWRPSGTNPTKVANVWIFPTADREAAVWTSTGDEVTWTRVDDPDLLGDRDEQARDVVEVAGTLVAVGSAERVPQYGEAGVPEHAGAVWVSADGADWARVADVSTPLSAAVSDGTTAWAFGVEGRDLAVWTSTDGTAWERTAVTGDTGSRRDLSVVDAVRTDQGFVVVGSEFGGTRQPAAWFSPDGVAWTRVDLGTGEGELDGVTAAGTGFVAVGVDRGSGASRALVLRSADGITWYPDTGSAFEVPGSRSTVLTAVGVHGDRVVAAGQVTYDDDTRAVLVWSGPLT